MIWSLNRKLIFGTAVRLSPSFVIPIITQRNENDTVSVETNTVQKTGWERVKDMYRRDEFGEVSIELHNVSQATMCGLFVGVCMGGFAKSRDAYLHFIENNQATIFETTLQAKKKLQDQVTLAFAKGGFHWGWRLGLFTGLFSLISTTFSVYRDYVSLGDYVTAGTITGAMYKANLGPAAMTVGAILGGVLSFFGGVLIMSILKATGVSMEDIRKSLHKIKEARLDQFNQAVDKASDEKHDSLTMHHDAMIEAKGAKKLDEIS